MAGRIRVRDVVLAHLERLAAVQPVLNAAVVIRWEAALREADELQADLRGGAAPGALCGVPFTVKDVIATAGTETCCGSAAFIGNVPVADAVAVQRFRAAGAILIAKTNCPEFAFGVTTGNAAFGITGNPWGLHSPGGSSGGEAALVAAGASALGLGTDYGGSLRWPAQCVGVLALRPGRGRIPGSGQLPEAGGRMDGRVGDTDTGSVQRDFQVIGPMARDIRDLRTALAVLAAEQSAPLPYEESAMAIGWVDAESSQAVDPDVQSVVGAAVAVLTASGYEIVGTPGVLDGLHGAFNRLRATDPLEDLRAAVAGHRAAVGPDALAQLDSAPASDAEPGRLRDELDVLRARVLDQLGRTPILLAPVAPVAACSLEGTAEIAGRTVGGFALMSLCRAVSALALPTLSIPVGLDRNGLPVSVQVIAAQGREESVLQVGTVLEKLCGGLREPPWLAG